MALILAIPVFFSESTSFSEVTETNLAKKYYFFEVLALLEHVSRDAKIS